MAEKITWVKNWKMGIDRRKNWRATDSKTLRECLNAYVTDGYSIRRRPGIKYLGDVEPTSVGLVPFDGKLNVFSETVDGASGTLSDGTEWVCTSLPYHERNQIRNPDFDQDVEWLKGDGWSITPRSEEDAPGFAACDGTQTAESTLSQQQEFIDAIDYLIHFDLSNVTAGTLTPILAGVEGTPVSADGEYTQTITIPPAALNVVGDLEFRASIDFVGQIDSTLMRPATGSSAIEAISSEGVFNGAMYIVTRYDNGEYRHHYIAGERDPASDYEVTDPNCPHDKVALIMANKVWSPQIDIVRYSATDNPTDWTSVLNAGFLPTGTKAPGSPEAIGLAEFLGKLMVFHEDSIQIWAVDPNPELHGLDSVISNLGTKYPRAIMSIADDLIFLTQSGYRSLSQRMYTTQFETIDIGTPIDEIVQPLLPGISDELPRAAYVPRIGQMIVAIGQDVHAFTISKSSKIKAWTRYRFPFSVDDFANMGEKLYIRSGDSVYEFDADFEQDVDTDFDIEVAFGYEDLGQPGLNKMVMAADYVMEGQATISHGFDSRAPTLEAASALVDADTRPGPLYPVGINATEISMRLRANSSEWTLIDAFSYHFTALQH